MHTAQWLLAAAAVVLAAGGYRYSLYRHPTRKCHGCGGTGTHRAFVWRYAKGPCTTKTVIGPRAECDRGRVPRWGVRLMHLDD